MYVTILLRIITRLIYPQFYQITLLYHKMYIVELNYIFGVLKQFDSDLSKAFDKELSKIYRSYMIIKKCCILQLQLYRISKKS